jgi:hypothetical protein
MTKPINEMAREFIVRRSWPKSKYTRHQCEWVDGSRVLEFSAAFLSAKEGLFVIVTFDGGTTHRLHGPVDGVGAADALLEQLAVQMSEAVDAAYSAMTAELDKFEWPDWPEVGPA